MSEFVAARPGTATADAVEKVEAPEASLGGWLQLLLFIVGLSVGVAVQTYVSPPPPPNPYAELPLVGEPPEAAALLQMIMADDARGLAREYDVQLLQALGPALEPLVDVFEAKFVGATERHGDILASYVLSGRAGPGVDYSVGVVFRVTRGIVVGVN